MDAQATSLTARQVLERIKSNFGVPWMDQTVDTFKDGDPDTRVTGIAVTMMATLDVLERHSSARSFASTTWWCSGCTTTGMTDIRTACRQA
jgi:hypothetical protein